MAHPGTVIGWKLNRGDRERLLKRLPPRYDNVVADHVTLKIGSPNTPIPKQVRAEVVGRADDRKSLECLVVSIDGTTDRPGGSTFHITWSLGPGRHAKESNNVLREFGWQTLEAPIPIRVEPSQWP